MGRRSSPRQASNHQREEGEYWDGLWGCRPPGHLPGPASVVQEREQLKFGNEVAWIEFSGGYKAPTSKSHFGRYCGFVVVL